MKCHSSQFSQKNAVSQSVIIKDCHLINVTFVISEKAWKRFQTKSRVTSAAALGRADLLKEDLIVDDVTFISPERE